MNTKISQNIKAIILGLVVAIGAGYVSAATWQGAPPNPPDNNASAPINVGGITLITPAQVKTGDLNLNGITTALHFFTSDFTYTKGIGLNGGINGKVLQANASGNASWVATSSLGLGNGTGGSTGVNKIIAGTDISINSSNGNGTGNVTVNALPQISGGCYMSSFQYSAQSGKPTYSKWGAAVGGQSCSCLDSINYYLTPSGSATHAQSSPVIVTSYLCVINHLIN